MKQITPYTNAPSALHDIPCIFFVIRVMFHCISCVSFSASHDQLQYQSPQCLSMLGRKWKKTLILLQNNAENFCGSKRQQGLGKESELPWAFSFYSLPSFVPTCLEQHCLKLTGFFPPLRQLHCPRQAHSRLDSLPCNSNPACILQVFASLTVNLVVIQSISSAFHMSDLYQWCAKQWTNG